MTMMNPLQLLEERVSIAQLQEPAPSAEVLEHAMRAALRAPDHGQLRPWRFLIVEGEGRQRLGELFAQAWLGDHPDAEQGELDRLRNMPLRAPMLILAIARLQEHPKVPKVEQRLAVGAAVMNMMLAFQAQEFGCIWRTGPMAYHPEVMRGLGLSADEEIISFLYVGTPAGKIRPAPKPEWTEFVRRWPE